MININMLKIVIFCILFTGILPFNTWSEPVSSPDDKSAFPVIERDAIQDDVREYETQLEFLNNDLLKLKMDREWLVLKIAHIQDQNRLVPQALKDSRMNITQKIIGAVKKKRRLLLLIDKHRNSINTLDHQINKNNTTGFSSSHYPLDTSPGSIANELKRKISKAGLQEFVELSSTGSGLILKTTLPILFGSCKYIVIDEYKTLLKKLAKLIQPYEVFINVKGFTNDLKIKGKRMTNIELSAKRAGAVIREFKKYGIKSSMFKITGMGEDKECAGNLQNCRVISRRADIIIYFKKS